MLVEMPSLLMCCCTRNHSKGIFTKKSFWLQGLSTTMTFSLWGQFYYWSILATLAFSRIAFSLQGHFHPMGIFAPKAFSLLGIFSSRHFYYKDTSTCTTFSLWDYFDYEGIFTPKGISTINLILPWRHCHNHLAIFTMKKHLQGGHFHYVGNLTT